MTRRLAQNTLTLLVSNVGSAGLAFVLSILIGRALGEDGLGVYGVVLAWVFPLRLAAEFGLGTLITRDVAGDVAQDTSTGPDYLHATTPARLLLGGSMTLVLWLSAPVISADPLVALGLRVSAPMLLIEPFFGAFTAIFRAESRMWPIPWLNIGMLVVQVTLTAIVFLNGYGVIAALVVNTLTSAGQLLAAWIIYRKWFWQPLSGKPLSLRPWLRRAWPFALAGILTALQVRVGFILLERLANTGEAGYYAASSRFLEAGRLIPGAFFNALFPMLAALATRSLEQKRVFRRATLSLSGYGLLAGGGFLLVSSPLMDLTYGPAFAPAVPVLQLSMWALLPSLLRGSRTLYWYASGQESFVNRVLGLLIVAQVALGMWLVPRHGAMGAAMAFFIAEVVAVVLLWHGEHLPLLGIAKRKH